MKQARRGEGINGWMKKVVGERTEKGGAGEKRGWTGGGRGRKGEGPKGINGWVKYVRYVIRKLRTCPQCLQLPPPPPLAPSLPHTHARTLRSWLYIEWEKGLLPVPKLEARTLLNTCRKDRTIHLRIINILGTARITGSSNKLVLSCLVRVIGCERNWGRRQDGGMEGWRGGPTLAWMTTAIRESTASLISSIRQLSVSCKKTWKEQIDQPLAQHNLWTNLGHDWLEHSRKRTSFAARAISPPPPPPPPPPNVRLSRELRRTNKPTIGGDGNATTDSTTRHLGLPELVALVVNSVDDLQDFQAVFLWYLAIQDQPHGQALVPAVCQIRSLF